MHYVDKLTSKKYAKTNLLGVGHKVLQNIKLKGGGRCLNPNPPTNTLAEYKLSALQASTSEKNTINARGQLFITAKISGCALKKGSKTQSSLRPSNLQLPNEAVLMSCRIRAVEHRNCATGPAGAHPGLQDRILQNYTRIENAHKAHKKTFHFLLCMEVQQTCNFPFCLLRHYQIPESFHVKKSCSLVQQFCHATQIANVAIVVSACAEQP